VLARRYDSPRQALGVDNGLALAHPIVLTRIDQDRPDKGPARIRNDARRDKASFRVGHHMKHAAELFVLARHLLGDGLPFP